MSAAMAFMIQAERNRNSPYSTFYSNQARSAYPSTAESKSSASPSSERTLSTPSAESFISYEKPAKSSKRRSVKKSLKSMFH